MAKLFSFFRRTSPPSSAPWPPLRATLSPYRRLAWLPRTQPGPSPADASKFSGIPLLPAYEDWPTCPGCDEPMQLFVQLDAAQLPPDAPRPFGDGHLQVFYCTNGRAQCEIECEAFFPFSRSTLVRVIAPDVATRTPPRSPVREPFAEHTIVGWVAREDYPNGEELDELGCVLCDTQIDTLCEQGYPLAGDKLGGWPHWIQGLEYPPCPDCGEPMALVFQIDSDDHLPYLFGDLGCAHITRCRHHPKRMTIAWACS